MNALLETPELRDVPDNIETPYKNAKVKEPPTLSAILNETVAFLQKYVVFPCPEQSLVVALWIAHTWILEACEYTPYLHVVSPEKQCGKTRLLDCLELLVSKPWRSISPSEAVLFRKIEKDQPTLLLDEIDTIFGRGKDDQREPLRALLNAGFERKATIPRCVGPNFEVKDFHVFGAKALAGIGKLPDTIRDRCIPIRLERRTRDQTITPFRKREVALGAANIQAGLAVWAAEDRVIETLAASRPSVPESLSDRQADISEPLLAIADLAGHEWQQHARAALIVLCSDKDDDESLGTQLLIDIRRVFDESGEDKLPTQDIIQGLVEQETDGPWASWWEQDLRNDNPRGPGQRLARLLKPYKIGGRTIRFKDAPLRGYRREDFERAWNCYCPPRASNDATMQQSEYSLLEKAVDRESPADATTASMLQPFRNPIPLERAGNCCIVASYCSPT